jgi:hypothetical protein
MASKYDLGEALILPVAAIIETGNHISRLSSGAVRRSTGTRFVELLHASLSRETPWTITSPSIFDRDEMHGWIDRFPDAAMQELSFTDLSVLEEFNRQCNAIPGRRVYVWAFDQHLEGYERPAIS